MSGTDKRDKITGTTEGEILTGGKGKDVLKGGNGADGFFFRNPYFGEKNTDKIKDFNYDEGDCSSTTTCGVGEIEDCSGVCTDETLLLSR